MENSETRLSVVIIALAKGIIYREDNEKLWGDLIAFHNAAKDYFSILNLDVILDEAEGYAFLKNKPDDENNPLPKLIARHALTFEVSLLLALLRKSLVEFDSANGDTRFILSRTQIVDLIRPYLTDTTNQAKLIDKIETYINKVVELGFLHKLKSDQNEPHFEVKRILKAFIDMEWLQQFDQWLEDCLGKQK